MCSLGEGFPSSPGGRKHLVSLQAYNLTASVVGNAWLTADPWAWPGRNSSGPGFRSQSPRPFSPTPNLSFLVPQKGGRLGHKVISAFLSRRSYHGPWLTHVSGLSTCQRQASQSQALLGARKMIRPRNQERPCALSIRRESGAPHCFPAPAFPTLTTAGYLPSSPGYPVPVHASAEQRLFLGFLSPAGPH